MRIVIPLTLVEFSSERLRPNGEIAKEKIFHAAKQSELSKRESNTAEFAFGRIDPIHHFAFSQNRNPQLEWKDVPEPTKSFVLICYDVDVPSRPDDVNQEGREVPASLPRIEFFHWLLLDISVATRQIAAGSYCDGVTARGKWGPEAPTACGKVSMTLPAGLRTTPT